MSIAKPPSAFNPLSMPPPQYTAQHRGAHQTTRGAAIDRYEELKEKRDEEMREQTAKYYQTLPVKVRELVLEQVALYELNKSPFDTFKTKHDNEIEELQELIVGRRPRPQDDDGKPFPFKMLYGFTYLELNQLHGEALLDEAVT